jgi:hypothetical protein
VPSFFHQRINAGSAAVAGRGYSRREVKYLPGDAPDKFESSLQLPRKKMRAEIERPAHAGI